jgi:hypothetical protein
MTSKIEYRVRPVTRFIVTKFESSENSAASTSHGEFDNYDTAYAVGYALANADAQRLGLPLGDEKIQFPDPPGSRNHFADCATNSGPALPVGPCDCDLQEVLRGLPYGLAATIRRNARTAKDAQMLAMLDTAKVAVDA